jgi:cyd operon protein YbgT
MWYFTWILGLGFAVLLAIVNAMWLEAQDDANDSRQR